MDFFEDNLISVEKIESRFGVNNSSKKLLQIFEMLNKLKFYMRSANEIQKEMYEEAIANLRIAIAEELKVVSSKHV